MTVLKDYPRSILLCVLDRFLCVDSLALSQTDGFQLSLFLLGEVHKTVHWICAGKDEDEWLVTVGVVEGELQVEWWRQSELLTEL